MNRGWIAIAIAVGLGCLHVSPALAASREYIVSYHSSTPFVSSKLSASVRGSTVTKLKAWRNTYLVSAPENRAQEVEQWLRYTPGVVGVQPNYRYQALFTPNDPSYPLQWNLPAVHMPAAWDVDAVSPLYGGDPSIVVAVIDTGVAYEDFGAYRAMSDFTGTTFVAGTDIANSDSHPNDDVGHGTHVTATIAQATNNAVAGAGIAFQTSIMPIKVLDASGIGTTVDIAAGIDFAREHGADVINLSLGGVSDDPFLHLAIQAASNAGVIIVAAAGNQATSGLYYPARYDEVISVAATGRTNLLASYSNYGPGLDISAPGGDMSSSASDGILQMTCQTGAPTAVPCTTDVSPTFAEIYYEGTSQATPHVSAAAALLLAAGIPAANVGSVLVGSAQDLGAAGYDTSYGWGLLDVSRALQVGLNDTTPPSGTIAINSGEGFTRSTTVSLQVSAVDDAAAVVQMSFSNNGSTFSNWENYQTIRSGWDLIALGGSSGEGTKTVYAKFKDAAGNISASVIDAIEYDHQAPDPFTVRVHADAPHQGAMMTSGVASSTNKLVAEWGSPSDARSGLAGFRISLNGNKSDQLVSGPITLDHQFVFPLVTTSTTKYLHIGAVDRAGNVRVMTFTWVYRPAKIVVSSSGMSALVARSPAGLVIKKYATSIPVGQRPAQLSSATLKLGDPERLLYAIGSSEAVVALRDSGARVLSFSSRLGANVSLRLAAGNIVNDGRSEIVISAERGRQPVTVFDYRGRRIKSLYPFGFGAQSGIETTVAQTKSGAGRIAAGQHLTGNQIRILNFSGKVIKQWSAFPTTLGSGLSLASGDVNGDGEDEIIAAPASGRPEIRVFSLSGKRLRAFRAFSNSQRSGLDIDCVDIDGDGDEEIVTIPSNGVGNVRIYDERGTLLKTWFTTSKSYRGPLTLTTLQ